MWYPQIIKPGFIHSPITHLYKLLLKDLVEVDVARKFDSGQVVHTHGSPYVGGVEAHAERIELSIIGEYFVSLLGVVRRVQKLDFGVQLLSVSPQANLEVLGLRINHIRS